MRLLPSAGRSTFQEEPVLSTDRSVVWGREVRGRGEAEGEKLGGKEKGK